MKIYDLEITQTEEGDVELIQKNETEKRYDIIYLSKEQLKLVIDELQKLED